MNINNEIFETIIKILNFEQLDINLPDQKWNELFEVSQTQNISSAIYYNLKNKNLLEQLPKEVTEKFHNSFKSQSIINLGLKSEIIKILKAFDKENIPVILLKGSHLAFFIYESIGIRFLRDIDLIVPINKVKTAYELAYSIGYIPDDEVTEDNFTFKIGKHLPQMIKDNKYVLEIHGYLNKITESYNIPIDYLWNNSVDEKFDKYKANLLRPIDLLMHLIVHISYQDNFALDLRHYYDIYILLEKYKDELNWSEIISLSEKFNINKGVYIVLKVIKEIFNFKFPDSFFDDFNLEENKELVAVAIKLMSYYNRNNKDVGKYFKYKTLYIGYGNFFDLTISQKINKFTKKVFAPKEELIKKFGKDTKIIPLYVKNIHSLITKNKFIFDKNDQFTKDFIDLSKSSNKINEWIIS